MRKKPTDSNTSLQAEDYKLQVKSQNEKITQLNYLTNKSSLMKSEYQVQHGIWILIDEIEKSQTPYTIDEY